MFINFQLAECTTEEEFDEKTRQYIDIISISGCMSLTRFENKQTLLQRMLEFLAVHRLSEALRQ